MPFNEYFEKIQSKIKTVNSLEDLFVRRKNIIVNMKGLPFKTAQKHLVAHCYTTHKTSNKTGHL